MHQKLEHTVFTNHTQAYEALPCLQSYVVCIAELSILQKLRRLERDDPVHNQLQSAVKSSGGVDILVGWNPLVEPLVTCEFLNGLFCEVKLLCLRFEIHAEFNAGFDARKTLCQASHKACDVMVIAVVIAAVIVVSHDIKDEPLRSQRCFTVFALHFSNCPWNGTLDEV
jgi:hypothetical protein